MRLDKYAFMAEPGDQISIQVCTGETVTWTSVDPAVASVDQNGLVTILKKGETTVTATNQNGETETCIVTVGAVLHNPILPASWKLHIADGEPHVYNGRMYIYGSRDVPGGELPSGINWCSDDYHVIYSDDLLHWTDAGVSFHLDQIKPIINNPNLCRLWAPDVCQNPKDGKYYLFSCCNGGQAGCIMVSESEFPYGPFVNPRAVTIGGKQPICHIDPGVLVDDDGKTYITWPFEMGQLDPDDYSRVLPETVVDMRQFMPEDNDPFEGPSLRKRGEYYYYIYIQNEGKVTLPDGSSNAHPTRMAYMMSKSPLSGYEYKGIIIKNSTYPHAGNVHGSFASFQNKWVVSYHMPVPDKRLTRCPWMDTLQFNEDGTIIEATPTSSGIRGAFSLCETIAAGWGDDFSGGVADGRYISQELGEPMVRFEHVGDFVGYHFIDGGSGAKEISLIASGEGTIHILSDSPDGALLGKIHICGEELLQYTVALSAFMGKHALYIKANSIEKEVVVASFYLD